MHNICVNNNLLAVNDTHLELINQLSIDLGLFIDAPTYNKLQQLESLSEPISELNATPLSEYEEDLNKNENMHRRYCMNN